MNDVYIIAANRTPIGGFLSNLAEFSATHLGAVASKEVYQSAGIDPNYVTAVVAHLQLLLKTVTFKI